MRPNSQTLRRWLEFRALRPARYIADSVEDVARGGHRRLRILIASDDDVYTSEQQLAPLRANRRALRQRFRLATNHMLIGDVLALPSPLLQHYDAIFVKLSFLTPKETAVRIIRKLAAKAAGHTKLVYLDGDDDVCVQWPEVLPYLDLYVKKHVFSDREQYTKARIGKSNLTDYVATNFGYAFDDDPIPASSPVPPEQISKIVLGWNIGLDDKIRELRDRLAGAPRVLEDVDVSCRASLRVASWIKPLREPVTRLLQELEPQYNVLTPDTWVAQDEYYREMQRSRICVSPIGLGEICWRDFEAVLCDCLLVKPDMSHLETEPNIFVPNETYVPIAWDFSDMLDKCRHYLEHPEEAARIRVNARRVLDDYYRERQFLDAFERVLTKVGLWTPVGPR